MSPAECDIERIGSLQFRTVQARVSPAEFGSQPAKLVSGPLVNALSPLVNMLRMINAGAGGVEDVVGLEVLAGVSAGAGGVEDVGIANCDGLRRVSFKTLSSRKSTMDLKSGAFSRSNFSDLLPKTSVTAYKPLKPPHPIAPRVVS